MVPPRIRRPLRVADVPAAARKVRKASRLFLGRSPRQACWVPPGRMTAPAQTSVARRCSSRARNRPGYSLPRTPARTPERTKRTPLS